MISTDLVSVDGLACDWVTGKLYWSDNYKGRIEVSTVDGKFRKPLYWKRVERPGAIALDPQNG